MTGANEFGPKLTTIAARIPQPNAYDTICLDGAVFFVPIGDNLYDRFVPASAKGYKGKPYATSVAESDDVTQVMLRYLDILGGHGTPVHMVDIGAWVGDVAIKWAMYALSRGISFSARCYDPSFAGKLIPYNIELNEVSNMVVFDDRGVSVDGGTQIFNQFHGHSDASRLASIGEVDNVPVDCYPVHTCKLTECLDIVPRESHLIVKVDVEGIDAKIIAPNLDRLNEATLIIEFSPTQEQYQTIGASNFLQSLSRTHDLFDLCYLPRPTRATPIIDADRFADEVARRSYGYTDLLAVPRTIASHHDLVDMMSEMKAIEPSYMMA